MYSYTGVATMATAMLVAIGVFAVIGLACLALFIVGEWKVFKKAGYVPNPLVSIVSIILGLGSIFFIVLAIMGIVNAVKGECKMLPVIGKLDLLKKCK